ncbi:MAG: DUF494 family protein [Gammaproteobacteria bacterium]|nr:DUF494 family protein [Gammaproteobacteria bacterium]
MKDTLLEKLMQLFDKQLSKNDDHSSTEQLEDDNWGKLSHIENNTCFLRASYLNSKRVFNTEEKLKFTKKSFQFLEHLIQLEIIGERTLELIINQLLFSESDFVSLEETKWVIHRTLEDSLTKNQLLFFSSILYSKEARMTVH